MPRKKVTSAPSLDVDQQLAERRRQNRNGAPASPERDAAWLAEYLDKEKPTSYRKMAGKHGVGVKTIIRALDRAAAAQKAAGK